MKASKLRQFHCFSCGNLLSLILLSRTHSILSCLFMAEIDVAASFNAESVERRWISAKPSWDGWKCNMKSSSLHSNGDLNN